jgi:hypothetical protein
MHVRTNHPYCDQVAETVDVPHGPNFLLENSVWLVHSLIGGYATNLWTERQPHDRRHDNLL